jgi:hypothetical protein
MRQARREVVGTSIQIGPEHRRPPPEAVSMAGWRVGSSRSTTSNRSGSMDRHRRIVVQMLVENRENPPRCSSQSGFAHAADYSCVASKPQITSGVRSQISGGVPDPPCSTRQHRADGHNRETGCTAATEPHRTVIVPMMAILLTQEPLNECCDREEAGEQEFGPEVVGAADRARRRAGPGRRPRVRANTPDGQQTPRWKLERRGAVSLS